MISCTFQYADLSYRARLQSYPTSERYDGATQEVLSKYNMRSNHGFTRYYKTMQDWLKEGKMSFEHDGTIPPLLISYNNNGYVFMSDLI